MDSLSSLALSVLAIVVLGYIVYLAVRKGIRDGLRDHEHRRSAESSGQRDGSE